MIALKITSLTKYYKDFLALDNLNLDINEGEIVGFIGQNGAGKSTTLRCILNIIYQSSGKVSIYGLDNIKNSKEIKSITSYVPSEIEFNSQLKVKDILMYSNSFNLDADVSYLNELCNYLEVDINKKVNELSLGNKKKISIIQALIKKPRIIILDEPTSGLDPLIQEKLFKLLLEEKKRGVAIFLSSHNLSEVEKYCDRVAIIKNGKLLDVTTMDKFKNSNILNVKYSDKDGNEYLLKWSESVSELLKKLVELNPIALEIHKQSIEEEFLKYYEDK